MLALLMLVAPAVAGPLWSWPRSSQSSNASPSYDCQQSPFKHVIALSVDGLHSSDIGKWISLKPNSNISNLVRQGYEYTDAYTSAPSDSFPGILAQYTGATPKTTGVWFDDTWDWTFYAPGSGCAGEPGAEGSLSVISKAMSTL